jgi:hypothetical protein
LLERQEIRKSSKHEIKKFVSLEEGEERKNCCENTDVINPDDINNDDVVGVQHAKEAS